MTTKEAQAGLFGTRVACAFVLTVVSAHMAAHWLSKPLSWTGSTFIWLLLAYWLPPKSQMRFGIWLIIISAISFIIGVLVKIQPDMF